MRYGLWVNLHSKKDPKCNESVLRYHGDVLVSGLGSPLVVSSVTVSLSVKSS